MVLISLGVGIALVLALVFAARKWGKSSQRAKHLQEQSDVRKAQDAVPDHSDDDTTDKLRRGKF